MNTANDRTDQLLILGLGNEYLGDDAVGILAIRELVRTLPARNSLVLLEANAGGLDLLDLIIGYRSLILIDAICTSGGHPGDIYRLSESDFSPGSTLPSAHHMNLKMLLDQGRQHGYPIPGDVVIYAVEVADSASWRQGCTPPVSAAVARLVGMVTEEVAARYPGGSAAAEGEPR